MRYGDLSVYIAMAIEAARPQVRRLWCAMQSNLKIASWLQSRQGASTRAIIYRIYTLAALRATTAFILKTEPCYMLLAQHD